MINISNAHCHFVPHRRCVHLKDLLNDPDHLEILCPFHFLQRAVCSKDNTVCHWTSFNSNSCPSTTTSGEFLANCSPGQVAPVVPRYIRRDLIAVRPLYQGIACQCVSKNIESDNWAQTRVNVVQPWLTGHRLGNEWISKFTGLIRVAPVDNQVMRWDLS